jgi:hypothetical protein
MNWIGFLFCFDAYAEAQSAEISVNYALRAATVIFTAIQNEAMC